MLGAAAHRGQNPVRRRSKSTSKMSDLQLHHIIRSGRIPLFSNVNEFNNVVEFNIAGVVKINNVVKFTLCVTSSWRRACGPINCFDDKYNLTLLKIYQK